MYGIQTEALARHAHYHRSSWCRSGYFLLAAIVLTIILTFRFILFSIEMVAIASYPSLIAMGAAVLVLAAISFPLLVKTMTIDPGFVFSGPIDRYCYMCPVCKVTVREFDHHCGFLGTCVGKGNMLLFVKFLCFVTCLSFSGVAIFARFLYGVGRHIEIVDAYRTKTALGLASFLFRNVLLIFHRSLGVIGLILTLDAGFICLLLSVIYVYKLRAGKYSVQHRREKRNTKDIKIGMLDWSRHV